MDNSSSRIETLLKLAAEEDKTKETTHDSPAVSTQKYYEEQSSDSLDAAESQPTLIVENISGNIIFCFNMHGHI